MNNSFDTEAIESRELDGQHNSSFDIRGGSSILKSPYRDLRCFSQDPKKLSLKPPKTQQPSFSQEASQFILE